MRIGLLALSLTACDLVFPLHDEGVACSTTQSVPDEPFVVSGVLQPVWRAGFVNNNGSNGVDLVDPNVVLDLGARNGSAVFLETVPFFDLRGSSFTIETTISTVNFGSGKDNRVELQLGSPDFTVGYDGFNELATTGNALVMRASGTALQAGRYVDGVFTTVKTLTLDLATQSTWRIEERVGEIIWSAGQGTTLTEFQRISVEVGIDVGLVRPRLLAFEGASGPFTTIISRANAGASVDPICSAGSLHDDFDTSSLDPKIWSQSSAVSCALTPINGQLVLDPRTPGPTTDCSIGTGSLYDLHRGGIAVELTPGPMDSHRVYVAIDTLTEGAEFSIGNAQGALTLGAFGTITPDPYAQAPYDPMGHHWLRFRAERDALMQEQLIWEISEDGRSYTMLAQSGDFVGLDRVRFGIGMAGSQTPAGTLVVDGVNIAPR